MISPSFYSTLIHQDPIVIAKRSVLDNMFAETSRHLSTNTVQGADDDETGESQVGLVVEPETEHPFVEPIFFLLGTIPAGAAAKRHSAMFELGSEYQGKVFDWLAQNWEEMRRLSRSMPGYLESPWGARIPQGLIPRSYDQPLTDLGDWHRHPGDLTHPSGGDLQTAMDTLLDPTLGVKYLISPIVTVAQQTGDRLQWSGDLINLTGQQVKLVISFSYISRRMLQLGMQHFIAIKPHIVPDDWLPALPPLAWDLANPALFLAELNTLKAYGCNVRSYYRETRGGPPLELCFEITRPNCDRPWDFTVFVETGVGYPATAPAVKIIKDQNPEPQTEEVTPPQPKPLIGWLKRTVEQTPLVHLPMLKPAETQNGSFVWGQESRLFDLVMYLEAGEKVWKPKAGTTE